MSAFFGAGSHKVGDMFDSEERLISSGIHQSRTSIWGSNGRGVYSIVVSKKNILKEDKNGIVVRCSASVSGKDFQSSMSSQLPVRVIREMMSDRYEKYYRYDGQYSVDREILLESRKSQFFHMKRLAGEGPIRERTNTVTIKKQKKPGPKPAPKIKVKPPSSSTTATTVQKPVVTKRKKSQVLTGPWGYVKLSAADKRECALNEDWCRTCNWDVLSTSNCLKILLQDGVCPVCDDTVSLPIQNFISSPASDITSKEDAHHSHSTPSVSNSSSKPNVAKPKKTQKINFLQTSDSTNSYGEFIVELQKQVTHLNYHRQLLLSEMPFKTERFPVELVNTVHANVNRIDAAVDFLEQDSDDMEY